MSDHITPILRALHWLPVRQKIVFKVLLLTFKALNKPQRQLLTVPRTRMKTAGDRAVARFAPKCGTIHPCMSEERTNYLTLNLCSNHTYLYKH